MEFRHWQQELVPIQPHRKTRGVDTISGENNAVSPWLMDAIDGVHSFSVRRGGGIIRASVMVQDDRLCQLLLLSSDGTTFADTEAVRLRGCLPYMLHEEWYSSGPGSNKVVVVDDRTIENSECTSSGSDDDAGYDNENKNNQEVHERRMEEQPHDLGSIRVHLLQSLAAMVARSGRLLPEVRTFLLQDVLPWWDGSDSMGRVLCFELLPFMSPSSDWKRILRSLGPFVCYGSPQVQVLIISGLLTNLLEWWAALDEHEWHRCRKRKRGQAPTGQLKTDTLLEVMDWCVEHVQRAFLLHDGSESLCMATLDYLDAVVDVSRWCGVAWSSSCISLRDSHPARSS